MAWPKEIIIQYREQMALPKEIIQYREQTAWPKEIIQYTEQMAWPKRLNNIEDNTELFVALKIAC